MSRGLQRGFAVGVLVLLVGLAIAAKFLSPPEEALAGSVESNQQNGRRALLLLLRESGFDAEPWREAPARLEREQALLWLPRVPPRHGPLTADADVPPKHRDPDEPKAPEDPAPARKESPSPASAGAFGLAHYRAFVESGGTLVLAADDAARTFLAEDLGIPESSLVEREKEPTILARTFRDEDGAPVELEIVPGHLLRPPAPDSPARVIAAVSEGDAGILAVEIPAGRGRVVLLGDDSFLGNGYIGEHDHAWFAVRLAEAFAPGRRVLFDEYALGTWHPGSPASILASAKLFLASLHALLLIALVVLRAAWVREFARDPSSEATASPLLRARALSGLLVRARRFDLLSKFLLEGIGRLAERRSPDLAHDLERRAATPARSAEELERLAAEIRALERAAG